MSKVLSGHAPSLQALGGTMTKLCSKILGNIEPAVSITGCSISVVQNSKEQQNPERNLAQWG